MFSKLVPYFLLRVVGPPCNFNNSFLHSVQQDSRHDSCKKALMPDEEEEEDVEDDTVAGGHSRITSSSILSGRQ